MTDRRLTPLQRRVLEAMRRLETDERRYAFTPNEIGAASGARRIHGGRGQGGRGSGHRSFGLAQQIIPVLTTLRARGLISMSGRDDGWSGTAYRTTLRGQDAIK